jgi:hypothetical protein
MEITKFKNFSFTAYHPYCFMEGYLTIPKAQQGNSYTSFQYIEYEDSNEEPGWC